MAGHPIILSSDLNSAEYLLGLSAGTSRSIFKFGDKLPALSNAIADKHGIWFGSADGIYLFTPAHGLVKVSNHPGIRPTAASDTNGTKAQIRVPG